MRDAQLKILFFVPATAISSASRMSERATGVRPRGADAATTEMTLDYMLRKNVPQRLRPSSARAIYGTAKPVPFV
jgi:hypothetical protein